MHTDTQQPQITVTGRHLAITAALNDYAQKKIEGLHLDYPKIIDAHVLLEVDKYRQRAEVVLTCANHITIEAHEETTDLYASIDQAISKIARQMRKYKTRLMRQQRPRNQQSIRYLDAQVFDPEAFAVFDETAITARGYTERAPEQPQASTNGTSAVAAPAVEAPVAAAAPAHAEPESVETVKYPVKPMYVDEAVLQLELANEQQFLVFLNAKTEKVNVLYRRKKGDLGLIQPTFQ